MRRHRRIKRILGALVALGFLFAVAHSRPAKEGARRLLASVLSRLIAGVTTIERLDYRLWRGELELDDLAAVPDGGSYRLTATRVRLQITGLPRVSLEISEPELTVLGFPEGSAETPRGEPLAVLRYLEDLRVERGTFELFDERQLRFEDVDGDLLLSSEGHRLALHAARGQIRSPEGDIALGPLDADAILAPRRLRIVSASLYKDASFVRTEGELTLARPIGANLLFDAALEASLARFVNKALDLRGVVTATGRARLEGGKPRFEAHLRSEELGFRDLALRDISGLAELAEGALRIRDLEADAFGGRLALEAALSLDADGDRVLDLSWEGVDPSELAFALARERLPLSSRSAGAIHLDLEDWAVDGTTGSAELRLSPVASTTLPSADGTVRASLGVGVVTVSPSTLSLSNPSASVSVEGTIRLDGGLDLGVSASVAPHSIDSLPFPAEGAMHFDGELAGTLAAPAWWARLSSRDLLIRYEPFVLTGWLSGDFETATVKRLALEGGDGQLEVQGAAPLRSSGVWSLDLTGSGIRLPQLGPLRLAVAEASGHIEGPARSPDATVSVRFDSVSLYGREGVAQLTVKKAGDTVTLDELRASMAPRGEIVASGSYDLVTDRIEAMLDVDTVTLEDLLPGLAGRASLELSVQGTRNAPEGLANLRVSELTLHDRALPEGLITARAEAGQMSIQGTLDRTPFLHGNLGLEAPFPLRLETDLGVVPWNELARASGLEILSAWSVRAAGNAVIEAELDDPRGLRYRARFGELAVTTQAGTATSSPVHVHGTLEEIALEGLDLEGPFGHASLTGAVPLIEAKEMDVALDARLPLEILREAFPQLEVQGEAMVQLALTGSLREPRVIGNVDVADSDGRFQDIVWRDVSFRAQASDDRIDRLALGGDLLGGRITLDGQIPLRSNLPAGQVKLALEGLDIAPLLREEEGKDLSVVVSLDGELDVTGPSLSEISGSGNLQDLTVRARGRRLDLSEPASWRLDRESFDVSTMRLRGEDSELSLSLRTLDVEGEPRFEASAAGAIDLSVIDAVLGDIPELSSEGRAELEVDVAYSKQGLAVTGSGALANGRFMLSEPRFVLQDVSAGFVFEGSKILVLNLTASTGPGALSGGGYVNLDPNAFGVDLRVEVRRLPLELMDGLRVETSGSIGLLSRDDTLRLSGDLYLDRGLLTREIDDEDIGFSGRRASLRDPTQSPGVADRLVLDVRIATRRNLIVENSMAQLELAGNVSLGGTLTVPEVDGIVTVLPDGFIQIGRNRFQVRQGRADLRGFPMMPPRLELLAVTRVGQTLIQIELEGDADDLRTRLTAPESPELTEGDLASLLVTGRTLEQAGQGGQQIASTWMMASLADLLHEGLGDLITYGPPPGAGPLVLAEEADPTSRLTLGVPVTDRLSATYSIALNDAEKRLWILDYRVARNVWLRGIQENSNDYAIGVSQRFDLDLRGGARAQRLEGADRESIERLTDVSLRGVPDGFDWKPEIRANERYDYWTAQDEARRLTRRLVEKGYSSAVVEVRTESDEAQRLRLVFEISAGKPTEFVWSGDDPGK
ncbi:MAG TPA: translocation/assembly module TamB domain-containing protein, partial [Vicinamibacteria bacterium]|nr:translocation/assembly module TamB domain-containing protein [Vicinamibacteria bacterium]